MDQANRSDDHLRVLVVDDTVTYRTIVSSALAGLPSVEVVGVAANGKIALQKVEQLRPDLLTLDLEMPEMDGLEVLRRMRPARGGVGVIVLSALTSKGADATMAALDLGAFDFVLKPSGGTQQGNAERLRQELRLKIEAFGRSRQIHTILQGETACGGYRGPVSRLSSPVTEVSDCRTDGPPRRVVAPAGRSESGTRTCGRPEVVALGISTGGPQALTRMLPQLPASLSAAVLIVQHMPPVFTQSLAADLDRRCALRVCEAADGQPVVAGSVLIAPGGKQMKVEMTNEHVVVRITDDPPENSCRPSVDYLFRSVARFYGPKAVGVIMTGMGNDGAAGCRLMHQRGATILAQDQASCVVFGMPRDPIERGIAVAVPLESIASEITRLVGKGVATCK